MSLLDTASLIVTPNGYKEGKLYSVIPSDGSGDLSVTRATTATRVNSAGLVELVPYNLFEYSEQFNNAYWNATNAVVTSNTATAPNGTLTADTIAFSSGGYFGKILTSSGVHSYSVYAKYIGTQWLYVQNYNGNDFGAWFDIQNGVVGTIESGVTASIEQAENGFYRCTITMNASSGSSSYWVFFNTTGNGSFTRTGSAYFWGAQLVEGSTAKDYQKTETRLNIPRLDYSNGTCPSLLVEPQRTNLALWSSSFDNSFWYVFSGGSASNPVRTANYSISPDGTQNAERLQCSRSGNTSNDYSLLASNSINLTSTGTLTIYLKSNTSSNQNVLCFWDGGQGDVFEVTPEWQRFTLNNCSPVNNAIVFGTRGGSGNYYNGGDNTLDISIWGAQLEVGSYSTSYIPTTSASVTRNADVISKTGISSLIGQTEGTLFGDFYHNGADILTTQQVLFVSSGNTNNFIALGVYDGRLNPAVRASSTNIFDVFAGPNPLPQGRHKVALAYKSGDFALYLDGTQVYTSNASATFGTMSQIDLGNTLSFSTQLGDGINAAALWQTRLDNATLAQLTTL